MLSPFCTFFGTSILPFTFQPLLSILCRLFLFLLRLYFSIHFQDIVSFSSFPWPLASFTIANYPSEYCKSLGCLAGSFQLQENVPSFVTNYQNTPCAIYFLKQNKKVLIVKVMESFSILLRCSYNSRSQCHNLHLLHQQLLAHQLYIILAFNQPTTLQDARFVAHIQLDLKVKVFK